MPVSDFKQLTMTRLHTSYPYSSTMGGWLATQRTLSQSLLLS